MSTDNPREKPSGRIHRPSALDRSTCIWLEYNSHRVAWLLKRTEAPFQECDVREEDETLLHNMRRNGVVEKVPRLREHSDDPHYYRPAPGADAYLDQLLPDGPQLLPCGHRPFRNLRGEGYTCREDSCDRVYERETIKEVIDGA